MIIKVKVISGSVVEPLNAFVMAWYISYLPAYFLKGEGSETVAYLGRSRTLSLLYGKPVPRLADLLKNRRNLFLELLAS
jgi:hypothetical protein